MPCSLDFAPDTRLVLIGAISMCPMLANRPVRVMELQDGRGKNPSTAGKELIAVAVLGLILLAAAGVLTAAVVTSNTDALSVSLWSVDVSNVTLGVVFVAGMITTVLAVVGLGLLMGALRRNRRLRKERRSLQRENEQLAQQVDSTPPPMVPPASTGPMGTTRRDEGVVEQGRPDRPFDDDRTRVQEPVPVGSGYDEAPTDESATTQRRRPFLPRRDRSTPTETSSPDA
jgi:type II secretory pathway pseudopilin PulG